MDWKTDISELTNDTMYVRGQKLTDLTSKNSFAANVYLILTGKHADQNTTEVIDAILSLSIDHGTGTISTQATRLSASAKDSLQQSLAAGLSSMSSYHGAATGEAAAWFQKCLSQNISADQAVTEMINNDQKIPGYGHRVLKQDERTQYLTQLVTKKNIDTPHLKFALEVEQQIAKQKNKNIPLNIDGTIGAIGLDLGLEPEATTGLFIIGRMPGLIAHALEQKKQDSGPGHLS